MTGNELPIVIAGGGVAGLATAIALGQQGRRIELLEQAAEIAPLGYGIQLGPNVFSLLEFFGISKEVKAACSFPPNLVMRDAYTAEELTRIPFAEDYHARFPGRYVTIHRADLHDILLRRLAGMENVRIQSGNAVEGYRNGSNRIEVIAAKGIVDAAALIAADGLRSKVREQLHPAGGPVWIGYHAHRTIIPANAAPRPLSEDVILWVGDSFHFIAYPLRDGSELNVVFVIGEDLRCGSRTGESYKDHLRDKLYRCHPEVMELLEAMNLEQIWPISDREPVRQWSEGRMTLVGDAAHATLQSLAQGAGMAFEDAYVLAQMLAEDSDYQAVFRAFAAERVSRTARVQLESRDLWPVFHCGGPDADARRARFQAMTAGDLYDCLDWLWQPVEGATGARLTQLT